jgi:hypothetical protein
MPWMTRMERRMTTRTTMNNKDNRGAEETVTGMGGCHGIGPGGAGGPRLIGHNDKVGTGGVSYLFRKVETCCCC